MVQVEDASSMDKDGSGMSEDMSKRHLLGAKTR